jgi:outer membrane protein assembly factor BamB
MARDGSSDGEDRKLGWQTPWDQGFVLALERRSGKVRWKTGRGSSRIAHVTPAVWTAPDGRAQVVSGAGDVVQGFDARTGERLWSAESAGEGVVPSIVLGGGLAFAASGWGGRESIVAFRLDGAGDRKKTALAWEQRKGMPHIPSFVYSAPHLFTITEGGVAACLRADSGEIVAQKRIGGSFSASPVLAEGRLYLLDEEGTTTVLEAGPELKVLATNRLEEKCQASPAVSGGRLFIRTEKNLHCIARQ